MILPPPASLLLLYLEDNPSTSLIKAFSVLSHQIHTKSLYEMGTNIMPMSQRRKLRLREATQLPNTEDFVQI